MSTIVTARNACADPDVFRYQRHCKQALILLILQRAGNVCFVAENLEVIRQQLEQQKVLIWGAYAGFGRFRISRHLYNDSSEIECCVVALRS